MTRAPGHGDPLALTAGDLIGAPAHKVVDLQPGQPLAGASLGLLGQGAVEPRRQRHVRHAGQLRDEPAELEDVAELAAALRSASLIAFRSPSRYGMRPQSGRTMPARQCSSVDLPEPDGPVAATTPPARVSNSPPSSAGVGPYADDLVREVAVPFAFGQFPHLPQVLGPLGVELASGAAPGEQQREDDLGVEGVRQVGLRLLRLPEPLVDVDDPGFGDRVPLASRAAAGLDAVDLDQPALQTAAAPSSRPGRSAGAAMTELLVERPLQVVYVARAGLKEPEQGVPDAHD